MTQPSPGELFTGFNTIVPDVWDFREDLQNVASELIGGDGKAETALSRALSGLDIARGQDSVQRWLDVLVARESRMRAGRSTPSSIDMFIDECVAGRSPLEKPAPDGLTEELGSRSEILDSFTALPDNYRAALLLKDGHGLTVDQTARLMSTTRAATRSILYRARGRLRQKLPA